MSLYRMIFFGAAAFLAGGAIQWLQRTQTIGANGNPAGGGKRGLANAARRRNDDRGESIKRLTERQSEARSKVAEGCHAAESYSLWERLGSGITGK